MIKVEELKQDNLGNNFSENDVDVFDLYNSYFCIKGKVCNSMS